MAPKRPFDQDNSPSSDSESNTQLSQNPSDSEEQRIECPKQKAAGTEPQNSSDYKEQEIECPKQKAAGAEPQNSSDSKEQEIKCPKEKAAGAEPQNSSDSESQNDKDDDHSSSASTVKRTLSKPNQAQAAAADVAADAHKKGKSPFVRIWTYESELAALKAMDDYMSNKGLDPYADTAAFFDFAKKLIPAQMTRSQVVDKLRRLREKYWKNAKKPDPLFSQPLEAEAFEISKKIWGGAKEDLVVKDSNKKAKQENCVVAFWDKYPRLKEAIGLENNGFFFKEGKSAMELDLIKMGHVKANKLEEKWKLYHVKEAELKCFRSELVTEQTRAVLGELMKLYQ